MQRGSAGPQLVASGQLDWKGASGCTRVASARKASKNKLNLKIFISTDKSEGGVLSLNWLF